MTEQLIDLFDAAVTAPVATRHGLAILGADGPMKRTQAGQYTPIAVDNDAPWSYWRIGDIKSTPYDIYACSMGALQQVPLRLVMLLPSDCGQRDILLAAGRVVTATTGAAKELLGAARVRVVGQRIAVDGVGQAEKISDIPLQWSLIAIDMDLEVIGTADCLVGCGDGPSVLCSVITTATNAEVVECLGDRINEICESGPSGDGYAQPKNSAGADIGTLTTVPSGTTVNVPIADGSVQLEDTEGTPLGAPVAVKAEETLVPVVAPDAMTKTTDGLVVVARVKSGGTSNLPQSVIRYIDEAGATTYTAASYNTNLSTVPITGKLYPDFAVPRREMKDSSSTGIGLYVTLDRLIDDTIDDIPDSAITLPNATVVNLKATQPYTVPRTAPLKVAFGAGDAVSLLFTATVEEAGSYNAGTIGTGTLQVSINGGAFASGAFSLSIGQTFQAKRSVFTAQDTATWARS